MSYRSQIFRTKELISTCKNDLQMAQETNAATEKVEKLREKLRNLEYDLRKLERQQWEEDTQRVGYGDE